MASFFDDPYAYLSNMFDGGNSNPYPAPPPNVAGQARADYAPVADPNRAPNGRLDATALTSGLGFSPDESAELDPSMKLISKLGNMRGDMINQSAPKPPSGWETIGNILKAASVPVSYYQGNRGYGQSMQDQLSREAESRRGEEDSQRKLMLQNGDNTLTQAGNVGLDFLTARNKKVTDAQQTVAKQLAVISAMTDNPEEASRAQGEYIQSIARQLAMDPATRGYAAQLKQAYPAPPVAPVQATPAPQVPQAPQQPAIDATDSGMAMPSSLAPGAQPTQQDAATSPSAPTLADKMAALQHKRDRLSMQGFQPQSEAVQKDIDTLAKSTKVENFEDNMGFKHPTVVNEFDPENSRPLKVAGMDGGADNQFGDLTKSGDEYLSTLPAGGFKNDVQSVIEGRRMPSSPNSRQKYNIALNQAVEAADPDFNFYDAGARKKFVDDNASSAPTTRGGIRNFLGTFANHLVSTLDKAKNLGNGPLPAWNAARQEFEYQKGDGRMIAFNTELHGLQSELGKALRGGQMTDQEARDLQAQVSQSKSPQQLRAALDAFRELVKGRTDALDSSGEQIMRRAWKPERYSVLTQQARDKMDQYDKDNWGRSLQAKSKDEAAQMPVDTPFLFNGHMIKRNADNSFDPVQ